LRRRQPGQTYLYLLCYAWQRYRQFTDNLVEALAYHMKRIEDETKASAEKQLAQFHANQSHEASRVGRLLLLYVDEASATPPLSARFGSTPSPSCPKMRCSSPASACARSL
jgi:hypothetical protein